MLIRRRLVSLYAVFRNFVALVITSGKTTWGYQELLVSHKLEYGPQHYRDISKLNAYFPLMSEKSIVLLDIASVLQNRITRGEQATHLIISTHSTRLSRLE